MIPESQKIGVTNAFTKFIKSLLMADNMEEKRLQKVKKVIINDDLEGVGNIHSFVYENTLLPVVVTSVPTGDQMDIGFIVCLVMGSALASCFLFYRRKKEEE